MQRNKIIENIAKIRKSKGISQEYLSEKLGMKQSGYALVESGKNELRYSSLLLMAMEFEMDVIDIITYPDIYTPKNSTSDTTKVLVELNISNEEFIKMGLKEKAIQVLNKIDYGHE